MTDVIGQGPPILASHVFRAAPFLDSVAGHPNSNNHNDSNSSNSRNSSNQDNNNNNDNDATYND